VKLYYDARDEAICERRGDRRLYWLDDLRAVPFAEAHPDEAGFLFAGARPMEDYHRLVRGHPNVRDRPEERSPLLRLDQVLDALAAARVDLPSPRTWRLAVDAPARSDMTYPLFLRTPASVNGAWWFIEAGPGSCAGTAHEAVFTHVALRLLGQPTSLDEDEVGGLL
jgi:hypothetical protein